MSIEVDYLIASPEEITRMRREALPKSAQKFGGWKCKAPQSTLEEHGR